MSSAVLIIASTRAHADIQEILRLQDTISALQQKGYAVDLLAPRLSPLLSAALPAETSVLTVPVFPLCGNLPPRASIRRFVIATLMVLRGIALCARKDYVVLHGFNDGARIARMIDQLSLTRRPFIAELPSPSADPKLGRGLRIALARFFERRAFRRAAAVILPDADTLAFFSPKLSRARVSLMPDPHAELSPDSFTVGDFTTALMHVYDYVLRPHSKA